MDFKVERANVQIQQVTISDKMVKNPIYNLHNFNGTRVKPKQLY